MYQVQLQTLDDEISTSIRGYMHYVTTPPTYIFSDEKPDDGQQRPKHVVFIIL